MRKKNHSPKERRQIRFVVFLFAVSLLFFLLGKALITGKKDQKIIRKIEASKIMERAIFALSECMREKKMAIFQEYDINSTGLIGIENSPMTTTLGSLEAKRTTTNPNMGALIVQNSKCLFY